MCEEQNRAWAEKEAKRPIVYGVIFSISRSQSQQNAIPAVTGIIS